MLVTEKVLGPAEARRVYDYQMNRYLQQRGETGKDVPLLEVDDHPHVSYGKGAVALYTLREHIGAEAVNGALRRFLEKYRGSGPPYPTSLDLYAELRAVTPPSLHSLLTDLFETMTLWDVKTQSAAARRLPDGKYEVTLEVMAQKLRADGSRRRNRDPDERLRRGRRLRAGKRRSALPDAPPHPHRQADPSHHRAAGAVARRRRSVPQADRARAGRQRGGRGDGRLSGSRCTVSLGEVMPCRCVLKSKPCLLWPAMWPWVWWCMGRGRRAGVDDVVPAGRRRRDPGHHTRGHPAIRGPAARCRTPGGGFTDTALGQSYAVGLHAEEVMMLSWENLLAAARAVRGAAYNPRSVEVSCSSKSRCHGDSGSHLLAVNFSDGTLNMNVAGCSRKLAMFINDARTGTVDQWKFYYFELAGARAATTDQMKLDASVAAITARAAVQTDVATRTPIVTARLAGIPNPDIRRGQIERELAVYHTNARRISEVPRFEREMRLASVAQAQAGIMVLQTIRKVDVSRIVLNPVAGSSPTAWPF